LPLDRHVDITRVMNQFPNASSALGSWLSRV
jgi:hypothetical protein